MRPLYRPLSLSLTTSLHKSKQVYADAISTALHSVLSHLGHSGACARLLFVDVISLFNCFITRRPVSKLLSLNISYMQLDQRFSDRPPSSIGLGSHLDSQHRGPPGLCLQLYTLYTYDRTAVHDSITYIKFAVDTTVVEQIHNNNKPA